MKIYLEDLKEIFKYHLRQQHNEKSLLPRRALETGTLCYKNAFFH